MITDDRLPPDEADALLRAALADVHPEIEALADESGTPERFAAQRAAILRQLGEAQADVRVLAFPTRPGTPASRATRPASRWLAAAAVAGLVLGLGAGQLRALLLPASMSVVARAARPAPAAAPVLPRLADAPILADGEVHDEQFLREMEVTLHDRGVRELRALDALTPRAIPVSARRGR